jgi:hypothetical protein
MRKPIALCSAAAALRHSAAINPQREITPGARSAVAAALCHLDQPGLPGTR